MRVAVLILATTLLGEAGWATPAAPAVERPCLEELASHAIGSTNDVPVIGVTPVNLSLEVPAGAEVLIEAVEHGNDLTLDVGTTADEFSVHADNPVRRAGRQWAIVTARAGLVRVRLTGKEHADVSGRAEVRAYALGSNGLSRHCADAVRAIAIADASYALGQDVNRAIAAPGTMSARHHYLLAVEGYTLAHRRLHSPADEPWRVELQLAITATYYQDLKDWPTSAEWAQRTRTNALQLHRDADAARAGALLVSAWMELPRSLGGSEKSAKISSAAHERMEKARTLSRELERFHRRRHEVYDAGLRFNAIGISYYEEGRFREAERYYRKALVDVAAVHDWPLYGVILANVAMCQWGYDDVLAATATFRKVFERLGPQPYPYPYLNVLVNSGLAAFAAGDLDTSLRVNMQILQLARKIQTPGPEAWGLYGLGVTYYAMGDRELARQYLTESLALRTPTSDPLGRMAAQRALSAVYVDEGRLDAAVAADEEALELAISPHRRQRNLIRLAVDTAAAGRVPAALELLRTAVVHRSDDDADLETEALIARGHIYRVAGEPANAVRDLDAARALIRRHDDPDQDFHANLELATTLEALNRPAEALRAVDRALVRSDELRRQSSNPEFRAQRQAPLRPAYDLKLALLASQYRQATADGRLDAARRISTLAVQTAEHGRAQSLADLSSLRYAWNDPALHAQLERRERLYRDLAARRFGLAGRADSSGAADPRAISLRADIAAVRRELDALNTEIARESGVRSSTLRESPKSWSEHLRRRAADCAVVAYWLGARGAYAWTITREGIEWTMLGDSASITDAARAMHGAFKDFARRSQRDRNESAAALYDRVVRPLDARARNDRELLIVPDGALNYVPFAALRTGHEATARYLIEDHDVALAPAVWWLFDSPLSPREDRPTRYLVVSDPIYARADPRLGLLNKPGGSDKAAEPDADRGAGLRFAELERLQWTAREAQLIATLVPRSQVDELSGAEATRDRLLATDWSKYRVIHVASHGMVDSAMPRLSALLLGAYDSRGQRVEQAVRAVDIESLTLRADIVTLSACDTAVGKEVVGEGLVGLASTTLARGAGAVLASLWPSADEISARLMTEFYKGVLVARVRPSAALGSAMRTMLARNPQADPAFWAVYQLSISHLDVPGVGRRAGSVVATNEESL